MCIDFEKNFQYAFLDVPSYIFDQGNKTPAQLCLGANISKILMLQMLSNLISSKVLMCCFGSFCFKKSFISKLTNITNVASVTIANLTCVRIAMTSPMQSKARGFIALF